ncbi:hypothetical protein RDWZM_005997 [Blomia tropicalis]|uniref:Uncharacterized protein n=1 Tax=Blomia tropicalis TaxID=40697 RepID=A0A9Q0M6N7_BLOTA|nr:hypothetical protein RDWZM_005997 [Blomia tropicalis]
MHDYKYVMETDVSSDYTNGLTINSSHSSMVYVYGEIEHGFSFTGSGRLKLIGNFFYGHWHKDGLQESPIVRNCTIELSDGIANVFICDFREITIMTNRRAKMQVFCVNKHDSKKSHMIYENIPLNEQKSETEKDTIQERILFDKTICKVQSQERNSKIKRKISKSLLVSKSINIFNDPEMVQTLRKLSEQYFLKKPVQSEQINLNEKTDLKLQSAKNQSLQSNETNKTASTFGSLQSTISNQESPIHSKVIFAEQILPELNKVCNSKTGMVQKIRIKLELAEIMRKWKVLTSSGISKLKQKTNKQLQCELNLLENKVEHLTILLHHFISCIPKQVKLSQNVNELKSCSLKLDTKNFAQYSSQFYEILQRIENQLIDIKL